MIAAPASTSSNAHPQGMHYLGLGQELFKLEVLDGYSQIMLVGVRDFLSLILLDNLLAFLNNQVYWFVVGCVHSCLILSLFNRHLQVHRQP